MGGRRAPASLAASAGDANVARGRGRGRGCGGGGVSVWERACVRQRLSEDGCPAALPGAGRGDRGGARGGGDRRTAAGAGGEEAPQGPGGGRPAAPQCTAVPPGAPQRPEAPRGPGRWSFKALRQGFPDGLLPSFLTD